MANLLNIAPDQAAQEILDSCPLLGVKLSRALFCQASECRAALTEVIKFMLLAAESLEGPITPSARVDLAWHEFILFTRTYTRFCEEKLGKMVHHEPSNDHENNSRQYAQTLRRYRVVFGEPPTDYWGGVDGFAGRESAFCGSCESNQT